MQASVILFCGNSQNAVFGDALQHDLQNFAMYASAHSITLVSCCPHTSYFCTSDGFLYGAGLNDVGEMCCNPSEQAQVKQFTKIFEHVKFVACGNAFLLILSRMCHYVVVHLSF